MTIGVAARESGVPVRTLRFYAEQDLIVPLGRSAKGYRLYGPQALEDLSFLKGAKRLGLHLDDIRQLLRIRRRGQCPCDRTREFVVARLEDTDVALRELRGLRDQMRRTLRSWEPTRQAAGPSPCRSFEAPEGS